MTLGRQTQATTSRGSDPLQRVRQAVGKRKTRNIGLSIGFMRHGHFLYFNSYCNNDC